MPIFCGEISPQGASQKTGTESRERTTMNGQTGAKNAERSHRAAVRCAGLPAWGKREGVFPSRRPL